MAENKKKEQKVLEHVADIKAALVTTQTGKFVLEVIVLSEHKRPLKKQLVRVFEKKGETLLNQLMEPKETNEHGIAEFPIVFSSSSIKLRIKCGGKEEDYPFACPTVNSQSQQRKLTAEERSLPWYKFVIAILFEQQKKGGK